MTENELKRCREKLAKAVEALEGILINNTCRETGKTAVNSDIELTKQTILLIKLALAEITKGYNDAK